MIFAEDIRSIVEDLFRKNIDLYCGYEIDGEGIALVKGRVLDAVCQYGVTDIQVYAPSVDRLEFEILGGPWRSRQPL